MARIKGTQLADLVRAVRGMQQQGTVARGCIAEMVRACGVDEVDVQVREIFEHGCRWKVTWR